MESHGVTCHPTQMNLPRLTPARTAGTCFTCQEGWKAELTLVAGCIPRWFPHPHTVTHPSTNRARRRVTTLIESNALPPSQATTIHLVCVGDSRCSTVRVVYWRFVRRFIDLNSVCLSQHCSTNSWCTTVRLPSAWTSGLTRYSRRFRRGCRLDWRALVLGLALVDSHCSTLHRSPVSQHTYLLPCYAALTGGPQLSICPSHASDFLESGKP